MSNEYGADIATSVERITGSWEVDGEEYKLVTKDTRKKTLDLIGEYMELAQTVQSADEPSDIPEGLGEDLDNFPWEDDGDERDMVESVVSEKLIKPDVDVNEVPQRKLRALFEGMLDAWSSGERVEAAKAEMPLEGNR